MVTLKRVFDLRVAIVLLSLLIVPLFLRQYHLVVLNLIMIYVIVIMGYNFVLGYTGLLSLAHAALYGLGAYSTSVFMVKLEIPLYLSFVMGGIFTALVGLLICFLLLKTDLSGLYLGMVTFAFAEVLVWIFLHWEQMTGGAFGFAIGSKYTFQGSAYLKSYYLSFFCASLLFWFAVNVITSKLGRALRSIRDSEEASMAMGINTSSYKLLSFVLSAFYAGIGGGLYSIVMRQIYPGNFGMHELLKQFSMLIIGGQGTISGSLIGAFLLPLLTEVLRNVSILQDLFYCLILVLFMIFMPEGISGLQFKIRRNWVGKILRSGNL
jgi:branched-chain amino acid transport system permease protein